MRGQTEINLALLRERGMRVTPQRLMILEIIRSQPGHLTVEEIYQQIHEQHPTLNLATIYRTLQCLHDQGLVSTFDLGSERIAYEYRESQHHHLHCQRCETTIETDDSALDTLKADLLARYGFQANFDHLAIVGICQTCREATDLTLRDVAPAGSPESALLR